MAKLIYSLHTHPEWDVLAPLQMMREGGPLLVRMRGGEITLTDEFVQVKEAHLGLTAFRAGVFDRLGKPWFWEQPDPYGGWGEGRIDADIWFWQQCEKAGIRAAMAMDIPIGHLQQVITWPGQDFKPIYQVINDFNKYGKPAGVFTRSRALETKQALEKEQHDTARHREDSGAGLRDLLSQGA
jgi:hypothetical protein